MVTLKRNEFAVAIATLALLGYTLTLSAVYEVVSSVQTDKTISNVGSVKAVGVGIYWDQNCTEGVSAIDWGMLEPGSSKNVSVYIRNDGNSMVNLSMTTSNWSPSNASDYITLNWDYTGHIVDPEAVIEVTLILAVSSNITGVTNFSFDIVIVGSG